MNSTEKILHLGKIYARAKNLSLSSVALYASNDGKLFERLKSKKTITLSRLERVTQWFSNNWPCDIAWPTEIERPKPTTKTKRSA